MKNKSQLFLIIFTLFVCFSCSKKSEDIVSIIPANASSVTIVNAQSLIEKSQYDFFKNQKISQVIEKMQKVMNNDQRKLINDFTQDANSLGLDLKNDIYIYTDSVNVGVLSLVLDSKILRTSLLNSGVITKGDIQKEGSINYVSKFYPDFVFAWDDNHFLLTKDIQTSYTNKQLTQDESISYIKKQMTQSYKNSIAENPQFKKFLLEKGDISIFTNLANASSLYQNQLFSNFISLDKVADGIDIASYIKFEQGEIKVSNKYLYTSPEAEKHFIDIGNKLFGTLHSDQIAYIPEDYIMILSANIHGKEISNFLDSSSDRSGYSDNIFFKNLMNNLDGDVTIALTSDNEDILNSSSGLISDNIAILAEVSNPQLILNFLISFVESKGIGKTIKNDSSSYQISFITDDIVYLRIIDNFICITSDKKIDLNLKNREKNSRPYKDITKDKSIVLLGNSDKVIDKFLLSSTQFYSNPAFATSASLASILEEYQFSVKSGDFNIEGSISTQNKQENSLKSFCSKLDRSITDLSSLFF